jgi:hypothetical protein
MCKRRVAAFCAVIAGVALPAYANNPPRPDGVLYLILVFPLLAVAAHLAGVEPASRGWGTRIVRGVFFTFVILASASGTDMGFLAMLVIVIHGLVRSFRIAALGTRGRRRYVAASVAVVGTLLAAVGYVWAIASSSGPVIKRSRQKRTMADMRAVSTAVMSWSMDHAEVREGETGADPAIEGEGPLEAPAGEEEPSTDAGEVVFADGEGPPLISHAELGSFLVPEYIAEVPELDGWRRSLEYRFDPETHRFQVRSAGDDHRFDADRYTSGPFDRSDFDHDIVHAAGAFVCWPAP